jgi:hypothetical protein
MLDTLLERADHASATEIRLVFFLLIASAVWVALSRSQRAILPWTALIVASVAWLLVDHQVEGRILWTVMRWHGLTQADLVVPVFVLAAAGGRAAAARLRSGPVTRRRPARSRRPS